MSDVKVLGHLAPDTDATVSAIACAWFLREVKGIPAKAYVCGALNREAEFVLNKFGVETPELVTTLGSEDTVAIVDTNNPEELPEGIGEATITGILDHHKLVGGLSTAEPISMTILPLASTCSVIWNVLEHEKVTDIPEDLAGIMLAAILSDTLKFTSPTTTDYDRKVADKLAAIAGVEMDILADEMFAAKSNLEGFSARDILLSDSKVFTLGGKRARVSVLETTLPGNALEMRDAIVEDMVAMKAEEGLDLAFLFVVDILKSESQLIVAGDEEREVAGNAFGVSETLPGVVSRKKQMIPALEKALS